MTRRPSVLLLIVIAGALVGCAGSGIISPNDPEYGRTGAPRASEYYVVRGPYSPLDSGGGGGGGGGGM
jgi:hypothetical protein